MDSTTFSELLMHSVIEGFKTDLAIGWNVLLAHPWLIALIVGVAALGTVVTLARGLTKAWRHYR